MKVVTLERFSMTPTETLGLLKIVGTSFKVVTIERAWKDNQRNISCIPMGQYKMRNEMFNRGGYMSYTVMDVSNRTHIKFHTANKANQLQGCIAPGTELGILDNRLAVLNSGVAFEAFMAYMGSDPDAALIISERRLYEMAR